MRIVLSTSKFICFVGRVENLFISYHPYPWWMVIKPLEICECKLMLWAAITMYEYIPVWQMHDLMLWSTSYIIIQHGKCWRNCSYFVHTCLNDNPIIRAGYITANDLKITESDVISSKTIQTIQTMFYFDHAIHKLLLCWMYHIWKFWPSIMFMFNVVT